MSLKAAFFDVGDTLVEHWAPREKLNARARAQVCAGIGEHPWVDAFLDAEIGPPSPRSLAHLLAEHEADGRFEPESTRQETLRWYRDWFQRQGIATDGIDVDRLRSLMCVPLDEVSSPVRGAFEAVRWCADRGIRVVLVTNTLSRGDSECLEDWRRFRLADAIHGIVSSHSAGWSKPHPRIFERALELAGVSADAAVHVGDNLIADVLGAQQLGIRAVWRRTKRVTLPSGEHSAPTTRVRREETAPCQHPSEHLHLDGNAVRCLKCSDLVRIAVRPDAVIDDLTPLPGILARWVDAA